MENYGGPMRIMNDNDIYILYIDGGIITKGYKHDIKPIDTKNLIFG